MGKERSWNHFEKLSSNSTFVFSFETEIVKQSFSKKSGSKSKLGIVLFGYFLYPSHLMRLKRHCTLPGFIEYSIFAKFSLPLSFRDNNFAPAFGPLNLKPITKTAYATIVLNEAKKTFRKLSPTMAANLLKKSICNLRGLISNFCVQTKFYSFPRRPLFLVLLEKTATFLWPSSQGILAPSACLKTMLLQMPAATSEAGSGSWPQYLCIAKISRLFRTRSGQIPIGRRRCFLFHRFSCPKMIGENGGTK